MVCDTDGARRIDGDHHFRPWGRVSDSILDEISDSILDCVTVPFHLNRPLGALNGDPSPLAYDDRRHVPDHLGGDDAEIDRVQRAQRNRVEAGDPKELFDQPVHPRNVLSQLFDLAVAAELLEPCGHD